MSKTSQPPVIFSLRWWRMLKLMKMQPIEISAAWKNEWAITGIATDDSEDEESDVEQVFKPEQLIRP